MGLEPGSCACALALQEASSSATVITQTKEPPERRLRSEWFMVFSLAGLHHGVEQGWLAGFDSRNRPLQSRS